jgi:hypothetical protein
MLARFIARSEHGRVAVRRLAVSLTPAQATRLVGAAQRRFGVFYDTYLLSRPAVAPPAEPGVGRHRLRSQMLPPVFFRHSGIRAANRGS